MMPNMKVRPLFEKYQRPLLAFANTALGKAYLGIKTDEKIVLLTPDSWRVVIEPNPKRPVYQSTFIPGSPYVRKLGMALTAMESVNHLVRWPNSEFILPYYAGLTQTHPLLIPMVALTDTTFNPNADPESTSVDGFCSRTGVNETFATIRAGAGNGAQDSNTAALLADFSSSATSNQYDALRREICLFDTSSLPDTDDISAAKIRYYINTISDNFNQSIGVCDSSPASNTALANGDYGNTGTTRQASDIDITSLSTGAYNDWTFNATGIASITKTGVSKFSMKISADIDNSAPTWASSTDLSTAANSADAASNKPQLVVTHTPAPVGGYIFISS